MNSITGTCLCGQISLSIPKEALNSADSICICHCKNCRRAGGSLASINAIIPESTVVITGQPKLYQDGNSDSGVTVQRHFCSNYGSPLYSTTSSLPGVRIVKLGLFDEVPKPSMEVYRKTRPPWSKPIDDAKQFDTMPTK